MPAFLVQLDLTKSGLTKKEKCDTIVVFAADATQAKQMASAHLDGDGTAWIANSTATEIVAGANWIGWTFRVTLVQKVAPFTVFGPFEVVGAGAALDTIDEIGAALVTLINATAINGATYTAGSNTLLVAAIADGLGDYRLLVDIIPPGKTESIASLVGTVVDEGIAAADVSVVLPADAAVVPLVAAAVGAGN